MFKEMDKNWERKEYFQHYMNTVRTMFSFTVEINITELYAEIKRRQLKIYPVQIYLLGKAVQELKEFRMDEFEGTVGCWEVLHPSYTIFNKSSETFSSVWTPYQENFAAFYQQCLSDIETFRSSEELFPQNEAPQNTFTVSSLPWIDFMSFHLEFFTDGRYLKPVFTTGKLIKKEQRLFLPLAVQVHHAACDGYHAGKFVDLVKVLVANYEEWLNMTL